MEVTGSNVLKVLPFGFKDVSAPVAGIPVPAPADMPTDESRPGSDILAAVIVGPRPKKDELLGNDEDEDSSTEEDPPVPNDDDEDGDGLLTPISNSVDEPPTPPPIPKDEADPPMPSANAEVPLLLTKAVPFPDESSPYGIVSVGLGVAGDGKGWFVVVVVVVVVVGVLGFELKVPKAVMADIEVAVTDVVVG